MPPNTTLRVKGREVPVSNLDKVFYPSVHFTKADVIDYYIRVAAVLLPHLNGRAVTLKRYPQGVDGPFFYEKKCPGHRPPWVKTAGLWSQGKEECLQYCTIDDLPTLVWLSNLADLELHTFLATVKHPDRPTAMVFDLDPGAPADVLQCSEVALRLRDALLAAGLDSYPKTSGSKGLQIFVPLNTAVTFEETGAFAHMLAQGLEKEQPDRVVSRMQRNLRKGKVLIDWSQNQDHKTTVCVYSLRARERPTVSTPVSWDEVEECARKQDPALLVFETVEVLERLHAMGDLFEPALKRKQKLPRLR